MSKLTRRQQAFIRNLLDLYRELQGPIHYSTLAERIGVSRITAYDMLRLLEDKGFVRSEYQLPSDRSNPGRSTILYYPTEKAHQTFAQLAREVNAPNWEALQESIIAMMGEEDGEQDEKQEISREILERIPPDESPELRYCMEVITIITLRLRESPNLSVLHDYCQRILSVDQATNNDFMLFGGFALGLLVSEQAEHPDWNLELLEHVRQCQRLVSTMDDAQRRRLTGILQDLMAALKQREINRTSERSFAEEK